MAILPTAIYRFIMIPIKLFMELFTFYGTIKDPELPKKS